ncbi:uncharacterized protein LOC126968945 [Leptidea sinapis]|uniref:uncharacterized protein LOC126968945 n=1 Tax=Leptidea sinapis TaxID=189913 RepID=UPI0021C40F93|nr:uncharacterized protein LOC126968945 [Leptidea sinapis]
MSPLCHKNQILVSLLARQQSTPPTPAQLTGPVTRAYPPRSRPPLLAPHHPHSPRQHHTLSNILSNRGGHVNGSSDNSGQSHLQLVLQGAAGVRPPYPQHAAHAPHPLQYAAPAPAPHHGYTTHGNIRVQTVGNNSDNEPPSDKTLSEILDELIDNNDRPAQEHSLMDLERHRNDYQGVKEKNAAINAITQSLMQCETVSKSPVCSSPGTPPVPVYPVQSPGACTMGGNASAAAMFGLQRDAQSARVRANYERARLLHMQESQQMLVSPEAAEQPQSDLGSTINALVSGTPPNVAVTQLLPSPDFHRLYHPAGQMNASYGTTTNKIVTSQHNPMINMNRQMHNAGGGYVSGVAALHTPHTPVTPQPYHRAPRPHLGLGGSASAGGAGGVSGGGTSEYVRNELRAVVGARARPDGLALRAADLDSLLPYDMAAPEYYGGPGGAGR